MNKIQLLTMSGCHNCEVAKKIFDEIVLDFPNVEIKEIDIITPEGQEFVQKYSIMSSPGIVINGKLFSTGGVDKKRLVEKLKSLAE